MRFQNILAASLVLLAGSVARAETFTFTFSPTAAGTGQGLSALSFNLSSTDTFTSPNSVSFLYSNISVSSGGTQTQEFVSFGDTGYYELAVGSTRAYIDPGNAIAAIGSPTAYLFTGGAIFSGSLNNPAFNPGTYVGGTGTLTISRAAAVAQTPEPSSLALLATGMVGVAGAIRRRVTLIRS